MIYTIVRSDTTTVTLDCVQQFGESHSATATQHPVETGSAITDHVFLNNSEISIKGVVSDFSPSPELITMEFLDLVDAGANQQSHTQQIKAILLRIHKGREAVTVQVSDNSFSEVELFENCVITSLSFNDDLEAGEAIYPDIKLSQIRVVSKSTRQEKAVPVVLSQNTSDTKQVSSSNGAAGSGSSTGSSSVSSSTTPEKTLADRYSPEGKKIILANRHEARVNRYVHEGAHIDEARVQAAKDLGGSWDKENLRLVGGNINIDPDIPLKDVALSNEQRNSVVQQARLNKLALDITTQNKPSYIAVTRQ